MASQDRETKPLAKQIGQLVHIVEGFNIRLTIHELYWLQDRLIRLAREGADPRLWYGIRAAYEYIAKELEDLGVTDAVFIMSEDKLAELELVTVSNWNDSLKRSVGKCFSTN